MSNLAIELYDFFSGYPVSYKGALKFAWNPERTHLIPVDGSKKTIVLVDNPGLSRTESGYHEFSVQLVDLSHVQTVGTANGTKQQFVLQVLVNLLATNGHSHTVEVLDRWPEGMTEGHTEYGNYY